MKLNYFFHIDLFFVGPLQINIQIKLVIDISLKLQLLEANNHIRIGFVYDHLFKMETKKKGVCRFLETFVFETATVSQKHPSPMPFKATMLCFATPAISCLQSIFSETGEHLNSALVSSAALVLSSKLSLGTSDLFCKHPFTVALQKDLQKAS